MAQVGNVSQLDKVAWRDLIVGKMKCDEVWKGYDGMREKINMAQVVVLKV